MDDASLTDQWELSSLNHQFSSQQILSHHIGEKEDPQPLLSSETNSFYNSSMESSPLFFTGNSNKYQRSSSWTSSTTKPAPALALVPREEISVGVLNSHDGNFKWNYDVVREKGFKRVNSGIRPAQATEHIVAERKRREKLSQHFIALAAMIPGLKKTDKASILGDAIDYVKKLEGSVKSLEDQKMKGTVESVVIIQKSNHSTEIPEEDGSSSSNHSSSNENRNEDPSTILPGIEVRLSENAILVKIHCKKQKGVLVRILSEIEKHHLLVTNTSAIPFSESFVDITITAMMEEGFSITVKDLVKKINSALRHSI